jgi:hypothetical protein
MCKWNDALQVAMMVDLQPGDEASALPSPTLQR